MTTLSTTLNGMLDRLGASTETTRQFAADIGHELRGPLTASTAYIETLLTTSDLDPQLRKTLLSVQEQQQRMVGTLGALQVLARVDAGAIPELSEIEPGLMVEELVRLARHRHPTVSFTLSDTSSGATITGWPEGLRIAIDNLLDNAALHGRHPHGHVDVTLTHTHTHTHTEGNVSIRVCDDGPGIPSDVRESVRQRFVRGPSAIGSGTGLGLALVEQQAALHQGDLQLRDAPNGGLEVELTIPTAAE